MRVWMISMARTPSTMHRTVMVIICAESGGRRNEKITGGVMDADRLVGTAYAVRQPELTSTAHRVVGPGYMMEMVVVMVVFGGYFLRVRGGMENFFSIVVTIA